MKQIIVLIGLLLFSACEKEAPKGSTSKDSENIEVQKPKRINKQDVEAIDFLDYGLSSATKKAVANWAYYSELQTVINAIKEGDLSYFKSDEEIMSAFIKDLKSSIPGKITNPSINARLIALETKFHKLKSAVKISSTPKAELISAIKEFFQASSNLNLQMNKKLEKEAQNISKTNL